MSGRCFLITGATGLVGGYLLDRLAQQSDSEVHLLVRADSSDSARQRIAALADYFGHTDLVHKVTVHAGSLSEPGLGLDAATRTMLAARVTDVVHVAASISFTDARTNRRVNLKGTENLLAVVSHAARFFYVSTAYVAGLASSMREDQLDVGQSFRNDYEQSKFDTERLVRQHYSRSPELLTVMRPSIVTGEWETGRTFQFMTLYRVLRALVVFARRHPGEDFLLEYEPEGTQNYIPVDRLTDMAAEIVHGESFWGETYHLVSDQPVVNREFKTLLERSLELRIRNGRPDNGSNKLNRAAVVGNSAYLAYLGGEPEFGCHARNQLLSSRKPMAFDQGYLDRLLQYCEQTAWGRGLAIRR
jgi:thioester reductase-like protein